MEISFSNFPLTLQNVGTISYNLTSVSTNVSHSIYERKFLLNAITKLSQALLEKKSHLVLLLQDFGLELLRSFWREDFPGWL